jgi:hypothetical protein
MIIAIRKLGIEEIYFNISTGIPSQSNKARRRNKRNTNR